MIQFSVRFKKYNKANFERFHKNGFSLYYFNVFTPAEVRNLFLESEILPEPIDASNVIYIAIGNFNQPNEDINKILLECANHSNLDIDSFRYLDEKTS